LNFKEIYKSANDSLHADKSIINDMFSEESRKNRFPFGQLTLYATAAVLLLVVGFSYFNITKDNGVTVVEKKVEPKVQISTQNTPDSEVTGEIVAPTKKTPGATDDAVVDFAKIQPQEKNETQENHAVTKEDVPAILAEDNIDVSAEHSGVAVASSGGGGAGMNSRIRGTKTLSEEEYKDYIGVDFESMNPVLPEGMSFQIPEIIFGVNNQNGEITDDSVSFVATDVQKPTKILNVTISKLSSDFQSGEDSAININGTEIFVSGSDGVYSAQFSVAGLFVFVSSFDMSYEELLSFLNSIL